MNVKRIVLGGLIAGLVLNVGEAVLHAAVLGEATTKAYAALGVPLAPNGLALAQLVLMTFVHGIIGMLLYASFASGCCKPGVKLAVQVGLLLWVLSVVYGAVYLGAGYHGLLPANLIWTPVLWGLVEFPLAMVCGSRVKIL
ncbi:MAG: hypothetical protein IT168_27650 [Bryobacterales bacterium]|nr:hypothetical protein [Bryobacterales bacterium]